MIGTVVVPLDGSERSAQALPYATLMAERLAVPPDQSGSFVTHGCVGLLNAVAALA